MATVLERTAKAAIFIRWGLLALAIALGVVAFQPAQRLDFDRSVERLFAEDDPLLPPYQQLKRTFGGNEVVLAVYTDPELLHEDGRGIRRLKQISDELKHTPGVRDVVSLSVLDEALHKLEPALSLLGLATHGGEGIASPKNPLARRFRDTFEGFTHGPEGQTAAVVCMLEADELTPQSRRETVDELREKIQRLADGEITGEPAMVVDGFRYIEQDAARLGWTSTILLSLTIVLCFRSIRWVVIAIAVVQLALLLTRASLVWSGLQMSMVSSMLTAIVTVIGVATVVHIIVRVRLGRMAGISPRQSLARAIVLLAVPVFWACSTDAVGFAALTVADVVPVQDFGVMMAVGAMMVLVAVGLLTPGMALLPPQTGGVRQFAGERLLDRFLHRSVQWIDRYPLVIAASLLLASAAVATGAYRLQLETDFTRNFRRNSPIVQAYETVENRLGGAGVLDVVLPAPDRLSWTYLSRVDALQRRLEDEVQVQGTGMTERLRSLSLVDGVRAAAPDVHSMSSIRRTIAVRGSLAAIEAHLPVFYAALYGEDPLQPGKFRYRIMLRAIERQPAEQKEQLIAQVEAISREEFGKLREPFEDTFQADDQAEVTGFFVLLTNLISSVIRDQWLTFGVASLGIALTMLVAFRSPLYAAIALVPNALPILTVMGLMGWIGLRINMGAAMIAAVSIGLSVDSSIHYLSAFRRAHQAGLSIPEALADVQQSVGSAVIFSTLALVIGFATLCVSQFVPTIYFGVLVSLAMLGGLVGNLVILPVLLRLLLRDPHKEQNPVIHRQIEVRGDSEDSEGDIPDGESRCP